MITDHKETAPCGMKIHYSVDSSTDFITYCDINDRGRFNKTERCEKCSWKCICKPTCVKEELEKAEDNGFKEGYYCGLVRGLNEIYKIVSEAEKEFNQEKGQ